MLLQVKSGETWPGVSVAPCLRVDPVPCSPSNSGTASPVVTPPDLDDDPRVNQRLVLLIFSTILAFGWRGDARHGQSQGVSRPPNFIIIYADDLGYADIGPFSSKTGAARPQTPHLDRMAAE